MSMEEKELETIDSPAESEEEATPKKKKLLSAKRIEVITAIFLGVTALLTAWATWIGSLHGGNQATNYTRSNNLAAEGNSSYNAAMQLYLSDLMAWNTMIDYQLDADVAKMKGSNEEAKIYEDKLNSYIEHNCSTIMAEAIQQMDDKMTSPFEVEGTTEKYFAEANELLTQSQQLARYCRHIQKPAEPRGRADYRNRRRIACYHLYVHHPAAHRLQFPQLLRNGFISVSASLS